MSIRFGGAYLRLMTAMLLAGRVASAESFAGFDSSDLAAVGSANWGLKIVVLDVGQADAILVLAPNGDAVLIDSGRTTATGKKIATFLQTPELNGLATLSTIDLLYSTHYDSDHIGGLPSLVSSGIAIRKALDQGVSGKRKLVTGAGNPTVYSKYVAAVGDLDGDLIQDGDEPQFVRDRAHYGQIERIGRDDEISLRVVSVRGDTEGAGHDESLDPTGAGSSFDENPGSVALIVRLGEFEFYTAGDQTDDDWKSKPPVEAQLLVSEAIEGGNDIDVIKVSHHGSDTSSSKALAEKMRPEVAIVSTKFRKGDKLPKKIVLRQFQESRSYVLITGDGINPDTEDYSDAKTDLDDEFEVSDDAVFNDQGNVTVFVSRDGSRYTVRGSGFARTFSSVDADNAR
jgi:competence protein ComEC